MQIKIVRPLFFGLTIFIQFTVLSIREQVTGNREQMLDFFSEIMNKDISKSLICF